MAVRSSHRQAATRTRRVHIEAAREGPHAELLEDDAAAAVGVHLPKGRLGLHHLRVRGSFTRAGGVEADGRMHIGCTRAQSVYTITHRHAPATEQRDGRAELVLVHPPVVGAIDAVEGDEELKVTFEVDEQQAELLPTCHAARVAWAEVLGGGESALDRRGERSQVGLACTAHGFTHKW